MPAALVSRKQQASETDSVSDVSRQTCHDSGFMPGGWEA